MPKIDIKCEVCGEMFKGWEYQKRVCCSRKCDAERKSQIYKGANNPHWRKGKIETKCEVCGKSIFSCEARISQGRGRFCSQRCLGEWLTINNSGVDNSQWRGGITIITRGERASSGYKKWRKEVLGLFGGKCVMCGRSGTHAHHIIRYSEDTIKQKEIINGICLCGKCHLLLHKIEKNINKMFKTNSNPVTLYAVKKEEK